MATSKLYAPACGDWAERGTNVLIQTYERFPVAFVSGHGARLYDIAGRDYVDFCGGIAVSTLGHAHPALVNAIQAQAEKLLHVSNLYHIPEQVRLAEALAAWTGMGRFFFCNSGTEANEALIKFARAWGRPRGRWRIVVSENGFHGRTLGALSATAQPAMQEPFLPLLEGFDAVPYGDLEATAAAIGAQTAAVLIEPVQGEGGANFAPPGFLAELRALCDRHGILLLSDEVQLGLGRAGAPLATVAGGAMPDAVSLAKGLGGGFPIGALGVLAQHADVLGPRSHGSTFGGGPLACAAAVAVLEVLARPEAMAHVVATGTYILDELRSWNHPQVRDVRGRGLFLAFTCDNGAACARAALQAGVLVAPAKHNTVRLLPPLVIEQADVDEGLQRLRVAVDALEAGV